MVDSRLRGGRCLLATGCSDAALPLDDRGGANGAMDLSVLTGCFIQVKTDAESESTGFEPDALRLGGRLSLEL